MFIVKHGIAVAKKDGVHVRTYRSGDYFGELALLSGDARQATVRADGPAECLRLDSVSFAANIGGHPTIAEAFKERQLTYIRTMSEPRTGLQADMEEAVPDVDATEIGTPERRRSTTQQWLQASQENAAILASHLLQHNRRAGQVAHGLHSSEAAFAPQQTPATPTRVAEEMSIPSPFSVSESLTKELDQLWRDDAPQAVSGKPLQQEAAAVGISEALPPTPWLLEEAESRVRASLRKQPPGTPVRQ